MSLGEIIEALVTARGYLVVTSDLDFRPGHIFTEMSNATGTAPLDLPQPFSILGPTDRLDWQEQKAWLDFRGIPNCDSGQVAFYYRAITD